MEVLQKALGWFRPAVAVVLIVLPMVAMLVGGVGWWLLPLGVFYILGLIILAISPLESEENEYNH